MICPPRSFVELLPDDTLWFSPCEGALDKPMDRLLGSAARSFAHRAIGVVLTGMGDDGARGARELHVAGGRVVVQSAASAESPEMPRAAISAGAADLVVPLPDIAQVLTEIVAGTPRPRARSELESIARAFGTESEIAGLAQQVDWSSTAIGAVLEWPPELRLMVRTVLDSPHPSAIWWGAELVQLYNDGWRRFLGGTKHPRALGRVARETWAEAWDAIGPMVERVMREGVAVGEEDYRLVIDRHGYLEEVYVNISYSPIRDSAGRVVGVHNTLWETTQRVLGERRLSALRELAAELGGITTPVQICERAAAVLARVPLDLPFALFYLFDRSSKQAMLTSAAGVRPGERAAPRAIAVDGGTAVWPLHRMFVTRDDLGILVDDLARRLPDVAQSAPSPRDQQPPRQALMLPLHHAAERAPVGTFIAGVSPYRQLDDDYRGFLELLAQQVNAALAEAHARQIERERPERLAELDRAKTEFFANVSHEFRTPLTLLLTPLHEMLEQRDQLPSALASEVDAAARNSRRLLRLVDNLLDFSEIETRRQRAVLEHTNLSALTQDVASAFRSAIERAGLSFDVRCDPALSAVPVNRDMWEKIVSNLLSNALKFTFQGQITVELSALSMHAQLEVADSGIGIAPQERPHIFKRFHRVRGAKARTVEGSGMGLAISTTSSRAWGGQLTVRSTEGRGTTFRIWLPLKTARTLEEAPAHADPAPAPRLATDLASEAAAWISTERENSSGTLEDALGLPNPQRLRTLAPGARVLVVDDNGDMREYLRRLLGAYWQVSVAPDGASALTAARELRSDLVLADVMMPGMDGFELLRAMRADEMLKHTPVIFLTARAGEDTAIEGLLAGADDYLAKPFSARELLARVGGQIELSRTRRRAQELNAFLVRFSDAVRGQRDPVELARIACRMVVEQLDTVRGYWIDVDQRRGTYVVAAAYSAAAETPVLDRAPFAGREPFESIYQAGRTVAVDDPATDPRVSDGARGDLAVIGASACASVPVLVDGKMRGIFGVDQPTPRRWTAEELAVIEGVAGRCWAEVERARAEAALRQSEAKFRTVFESIDEGFLIHEVIWDETGRAVDYRLLEINPAHTRMTGLPRETVGKLGSEFMPDVEGYWLDIFGRVARTGIPERAERYNQPTDRWYNVQVSRVAGHDSRIAIVFDDVTARKRAELALKASEEKQAFLLKLSDAVRPLGEAPAIQALASRLLLQKLGAGWCYYVEYQEGGMVALVRVDARRDGLPPMSGQYRFVDSSRHEVIAAFELGQVLRVDDWLNDSRWSASTREQFAAVGLRAMLAAPLVKDGTLVAAMVVGDDVVRRWTDSDVTHIHETAERTWAALERRPKRRCVKTKSDKLSCSSSATRCDR